MANTTTVTRTGNFLTLVFDGTGADYLYSTDTTGNAGAASKAKVASIMWKADADGDKIIIRDGAAGAIVFYDEATDSGNTNGPRVRYFNGGEGVRMNPSITVSECSSLGSGAVTFEIL
jgi:hypothetical protein